MKPKSLMKWYICNDADCLNHKKVVECTLKLIASLKKYFPPLICSRIAIIFINLETNNTIISFGRYNHPMI